MELIANRECGKCTVCCKVLAIDDPGLVKLPGVICPNCKTGSGCKIYETRPDPCQGFFCGWRVLPEINEKWRPDRIGVMIRMQRDFVPPGYQPMGLQFLVLGGNDVLTTPLVNYIGGLIANRVAVFLAMRGPEGFSDVSAFLNEILARPVAARDRNAIMKILRGALDAMSRNKFEPAVLKHGSQTAAN